MDLPIYSFDDQPLRFGGSFLNHWEVWIQPMEPAGPNIGHTLDKNDPN